MATHALDTKGNRIEVAVDEKVFPRQVSIAAAYRFLDRCYIRLESGARNRLKVSLKGKHKTSRAKLDALAHEFENELLHQLMRHQVSEQTTGLREVLVGRALLSADPDQAALDSPAPAGDAQPPGGQAEEDADLDYLDDPLGIAVPWEEKYGDGGDDRGEGGAES